MLLETGQFGFGDFLLDAREKILLRGGKPLSITPKSFQLLFVLVQNHGHLVNKDELMKEVWANSFVEESNLAFTIGLLRKTLGDNAQKPRFIETVPKRGYRFIAEVKRLESKIDDEFELIDNLARQSNNEVFSSTQFLRASKIESQPKEIIALEDWHSDENFDKSEETAAISKFPSKIGQTKVAEKTDAVNSRSRNYKAVALTTVLLLVGAIALGYRLFSAKNATLRNKKSIAVLPLKPINTANRDEIYEIGIADSLIYRLSSIKGFVIRPLSAIRKYTDVEQDPLTAGREQQVDYVLASNYQLASEKIRITAQLYNVSNGQIEETYKVEKDATNVFEMQDTVAGEMQNVLLTRFAAGTSSNQTPNRGTINEEAYRLYLQGMYLIDNRDMADARKAVALLEQAVELDPNYARAWAGKAYAHRTVGNYARSTDTHEEYRKSIEAINKALTLDGNLADAHSVLCENKMYYEYDFAGAERECRRAIELDPNSSLAHQVYSRYLNSRGRHDEAIAEIKIAIDLDPTSLFKHRMLGNCLHYARRYPEAVAQFKRVIEMDKNFATTYYWLSNTLALQGNQSEAYEWWMKFLALQKANEETVQDFQAAYQTSGWPGVLHEQVKRFEKGNEAYFHGASYNAMIGNKDKAFEYLERAYQRRELWMGYLQVDPRVDNLRGDRRFDELIKRVESK